VLYLTLYLLIYSPSLLGSVTIERYKPMATTPPALLYSAFKKSNTTSRDRLDYAVVYITSTPGPVVLGRDADPLILLQLQLARPLLFVESNRPGHQPPGRGHVLRPGRGVGVKHPAAQQEVHRNLDALLAVCSGWAGEPVDPVVALEKLRWVGLSFTGDLLLEIWERVRKRGGREQEVQWIKLPSCAKYVRGSIWSSKFPIHFPA